MCNLYRLNSGTAEIANLFGVMPGADSNAGAEVYPGYPGMVIAGGELRSMTWGFPLSLRGKQGQWLKPKPVNNARTDKLDGPFWSDSFNKRRCLLPLNAWAEAEGERGHMTRTWLAVPGQPLCAAAGIWRDSAEWGPVYSMVMTEACTQVAEVHTRMPVILSPYNWHHWIHATPSEAKSLCTPYAGTILLDRTRDRWPQLL